MGQKSREKQLKKQQAMHKAQEQSTAFAFSNPIEESISLLNSQALSIDLQIQELYKRIEFFGDMLNNKLHDEQVVVKLLPFSIEDMGEDLKAHQATWERAYIKYNDFIKGLAANSQQYFTSVLLSQSMLGELKQARSCLDKFEYRVLHYRNEIETFIKVCRDAASMDHYLALGQKNIDALQDGEVSAERRQALVGMLDKVKGIKSVLYPSES